MVEKKQLFILICSVAYEGSSTLGVFDTIVEAEKSRKEAIKNTPFSSNDKQEVRKYNEINAIDISDSTYYIEKYELNKLKRNY